MSARPQHRALELGTLGAQCPPMTFARPRFRAFCLAAAAAAMTPIATAQVAPPTAPPPVDYPESTAADSEPKATPRDSTAQVGTTPLASEPKPIEPVATKNTMLTVGPLLSIPRDHNEAPAHDAAWVGLGLAVAWGRTFWNVGADFTAGLGGARDSTVNLAACAEVGTPMRRNWPSLHLTSAAGWGFASPMDDIASTPEDEDEKKDARVFVSYGAIFRVPVSGGKEPEAATTSIYLSAKREHAYWFDSTAADTFAHESYVLGAGISLYYFE